MTARPTHYLNVYETPAGKRYLGRPIASREEADRLALRKAFMARLVGRLRVRMRSA